MYCALAETGFSEDGTQAIIKHYEKK